MDPQSSALLLLLFGLGSGDGDGDGAGAGPGGGEGGGGELLHVMATPNALDLPRQGSANEMFVPPSHKQTLRPRLDPSGSVGFSSEHSAYGQVARCSREQC